MSTLQARLQDEMTAARKSQDKATTLLLGTTLSEVKNREIELNRDLTDDDVIDVIRKGIKKRRESVEMPGTRVDRDTVEDQRCFVSVGLEDAHGGVRHPVMRQVIKGRNMF